MELYTYFVGSVFCVSLCLTVVELYVKIAAFLVSVCLINLGLLIGYRKENSSMACLRFPLLTVDAMDHLHLT